ncbi:MAG: AbrB/MazE/SpoVT family DNA-binding domain-containing protein [Candidatus Aenigmarchaeota archaeon]|nr:AbrB/MazE/SpoVT family DNA-binding domain-containing protein [Candidatus Aenigmarchaeota archaeon]
MQETAVCDERGRLTLGRDVTERFGKKFHVVMMPREVVLIPISKDPLKSLKEEGKKIPQGLSLEDTRTLADQLGIREAKENYERLQRLVKKTKRRR